MRVLVTGATGFIGSRLVLRCLADGHEVLALGLKRNPVEAEYLAELEAQGARAVVGSITEPATLAPAVDGVEVVFHLAAAQHEANIPDQVFHDVNVTGTRNLLEAAGAARVRRFVYASSIGVYGWIKGGHIHDDSELDPDNIYGKTKLGGEEVLRSHQGPPDWTIARISEAYGPGDRRLIKMFRGAARGRFPMIGAGANKHHLVYIDDLLDGLLDAAAKETAVGRTYVLAGPRAYTSREMLDIVISAIDGPAPKIKLPMGPMLLAATVCEGVLRPLGIQPPLYPRRMNFYRKSFEFTMESAREAIGWSPTTGFEDGAKTTAAWYREQGLLGD